MSDVTELTAPPALAAALENKTGIYEVDHGLFIEILEKRSFKTHRHFRASLPASKGIEEGFDCGPVYAIYAENSHVDISAGLTLFSGEVVRQTAVVRKLLDRYSSPSVKELREARQAEPSSIILPISSQRNRNYCRWWLDSVTKLFICGQSNILRSKLRSSRLEVLAPKLRADFQRETVRLLNSPRIATNTPDRLIRGRSINSPGLTFGGGQRIASIVRPFSAYLDVVIPASKSSGGPSGELLYISRNESSMRRLVNEEDILPGLRDLGFTILQPAKVPLRDQIEAFRNARVVLAAHGAGLTNIIFCRPGTTLIEIFPEGGVHGSAFTRIASQLDFDYFFVVGEKIDNEAGRTNPNNSDLRLDKDAFLGFVREALSAARA